MDIDRDTAVTIPQTETGHLLALALRVDGTLVWEARYPDDRWPADEIARRLVLDAWRGDYEPIEWDASGEPFRAIFRVDPVPTPGELQALADEAERLLALSLTELVRMSGPHLLTPPWYHLGPNSHPGALRKWAKAELAKFEFFREPTWPDWVLHGTPRFVRRAPEEIDSETYYLEGPVSPLAAAYSDLIREGVRFPPLLATDTEGLVRGGVTRLHAHRAAGSAVVDVIEFSAARRT